MATVDDLVKDYFDGKDGLDPDLDPSKELDSDSSGPYQCVSISYDELMDMIKDEVANIKGTQIVEQTDHELVLDGLIDYYFSEGPIGTIKTSCGKVRPFTKRDLMTFFDEVLCEHE